VQALMHQQIETHTTEIIVVGYEEQLSPDIAMHVRYKPLSLPFSPAHARNDGAQASHGNILVFLDSDVVLQMGALLALIQPIINGAMDIVGGGTEIEGGTYWRLCANLISFGIFSTDMPREERDYLPTMFMAVARQAWQQVGMFNIDFPHAAGEDVEWTLRAHRLGRRILFEPAARCFHRPTRTRYNEATSKLQLYGGAWGLVYDLMLRGESITPRYTARQRIEDLDGMIHAFRQHNSHSLWQAWLYVWCMSLALRDVLISLRGQLSVRRFWYALPGIMLLQIAWYDGLLSYLLNTERADHDAPCDGRTAQLEE